MLQVNVMREMAKQDLQKGCFEMLKASLPVRVGKGTMGIN